MALIGGVLYMKCDVGACELWRVRIMEPFAVAISVLVNKNFT